jgi:phosphomannomutase
MCGIFKAYDIRGSYPEELNETTAKKIGACFVQMLKAGENCRRCRKWHGRP